MKRSENFLDNVLAQLGDLGFYQIRIIVLLCLVIVCATMKDYSFVFIAKNPKLRCKIPQCEANATSSEFNPSWLRDIVPYKNDNPSSCEQFQFTIQLLQSSTNNCTLEMCKSKYFNKKQVTPCQNGYVYDTEKVSIVNDFNIHCNENMWKLTMVGTINFLGIFVGLPLYGLSSDRFGRKTLLIWGFLISGIIGIILSVSTNYIMYVSLLFLANIFAAGTHTGALIIGIELVGPSKRALTGTILSCSISLGGIAVALLAWWITSWRTLCLVIYIPFLLIISYRWLIPESVRWLLNHGQIDQAREIILNAAVTNKKTIKTETLDNLLNSDQTVPKHSFLKVLKSPILRLRFICCCFCWITCALVYDGITLNSVSLATGNSYIDFILSFLVEIPSNIMAGWLMERIGRRLTICGSFSISGLTCLICVFSSEGNYYLQLLITLIGKYWANASFMVIYVVTSEMFPTPMRHSMMGVCSMIGRIGSMSAPQMPLLAQYWKPLPMVLFCLMSTIAACLSLIFPETQNVNLPNTIEEAENIKSK